MWHKGKKLFHSVDDYEDSVRHFLKGQNPQIFPKKFQDFHRLRVSIYSFMLIQGLPDQLWDRNSKVLCSFWNESSDSTKCGTKTTENWHTQTSVEYWWHLEYVFSSSRHVLYQKKTVPNFKNCYFVSYEKYKGHKYIK